MADALTATRPAPAAAPVSALTAPRPRPAASRTTRRPARRVLVEPRDARLAIRTHARYDAQLLDLLDRLVAA